MNKKYKYGSLCATIYMIIPLKEWIERELQPVIRIRSCGRNPLDKCRCWPSIDQCAEYDLRDHIWKIMKHLMNVATQENLKITKLKR